MKYLGWLIRCSQDILERKVFSLVSISESSGMVNLYQLAAKDFGSPVLLKLVQSVLIRILPASATPRKLFHIFVWKT